MITQLTRIGNSRGTRIPKSIIRQCLLENDIELEVRDTTLLVRSKRKTREGWDDAFRKDSAAKNDDAFSDAQNLSSFDKEEWEW